MIRLATERDVPQLAQLMDAYLLSRGMPLRLRPKPERLIQHEEHAERLLGSAGAGIILSEQDGRAVGYAVGRLGSVPGCDGVLGVVEEMYVDPAFRLRRESLLLLKATIIALEANGAKCVAWEGEVRRKRLDGHKVHVKGERQYIMVGGADG